ncbi:MAG: nucleotidyl transferase AbiEii/AbiGii toxin family protein [bacterium]|nr:nucleotidyl transferase AbiEii/AbiGii toxin family protein [bacterium]
MKREIKDKAASVKAKLLNISKKTNIEFDALLLRYFQERFLYRLTVSGYSANFILKGGFLLVSLKMPWSRPTRDIDFLAMGIKNTSLELENLFKKVAELPGDDGVAFDSSSILSERIVENSEYVGIRLKLTTSLGKAWKILQFDIGFGDSIWPEPNLIELPTLLEYAPPKLKAYPTETIIAEKFEIMVKKGMMNSRMKDFFDIYSLSSRYNFEGKILQKAIENTLERRQTPITDIPLVFREIFQRDKAKQQQWAGYLRNTRISNINKNFGEIMKRITDFLKPVVISIIEKKKMDQSWNAEKNIWM